jgi:hypothetical protein
MSFMPAVGTNRTNRASLAMSVVQGTPEAALRCLAPFDLDQNETALFASKSKE